MKKPVLLVSNDWHIDESNLEEIPGLISQKIKVAKELGITNLVCLGDIFQSRKAQKESVLNCFKFILDDIYLNGMLLYTIPGNHDKTDYKSYLSFLEPFSNHSAIRLINTTTLIKFDSLKCVFIPFFEEQMWLEEFAKITDTYDILFSHVAINGSINNNKTKVESTITPKLFKEVNVFLGHYHNYQDVTFNIHHLPSLKQNNFGEDANKGFSVIYDDCSFDIINSKFKKYIVFDVRVDTIDFKKVMTDISKYLNDNNVKVRIMGPRNEIKGIDLDIYRAMGMKIDTFFDELVLEEGKQIDFSDKNTILEHFSLFCKERDINLEEGLKYLNKVL